MTTGQPYTTNFTSSAAQAAAITRAASKQTYYTVRFLVDRERLDDAYRAYAYFRWLDDRLDRGLTEPAERLAFVQRQAALIERCYRADPPSGMEQAEHMLVDLIRANPDKNSGLHAYINSMLAVMEFDARRQGKVVGQDELACYVHNLASAVTEALHYFIGHDCPTPDCAERYQAASGAHISHMLRDTFEDIANGYYNIPREFLETHAISPADVDLPVYRGWVKNRVHLARGYFQAGKDYLAQVKNLRCRLAGYAYIARFEWVLDTIEKDGYRLRPDYATSHGPAGIARLAWAAFYQALFPRRKRPRSAAHGKPSPGPR